MSDRANILPDHIFLTPFHNEECIIALKARELGELGPSLLVSDGSTDDGPSRARDADSIRAEVIELPRMGKTAAIRAALEAKPGDADQVIVLSDANVSISSPLREAILREFFDSDIGAVASPVLPEGQGPERLYWRLENHIRKIELRYDAVVGCSGACWAVRRRFLLECDYAGMLCEDLWIPLCVAASGARVSFVDADPAIELGVVTASVEFQRRSRIMAGNLQILMRLGEIWDRLPQRLRIALFLHKLARWAIAPLMVAGSLMASGVLALQGYLVPVMVAWICAGLIRPVRYFLLMNAALFHGLIRGRAIFSGLPVGAWIPERNRL